MNEGLKDSSFLVHAKRLYQEKNQAFGGPDGSAVTIEDTASLVFSQLTVTALERGLPPEHRSILDHMRINPLADLQAQNVRFGNPAIVKYCISWLKTDLTRLRLAKIVGQGEEKAIEGYPLLDETEINRQMTARRTAIQILEQDLLGKLG